MSTTPIVILHGLFGAKDNWRAIARHLATDHRTVHALDLPNHGDTDHFDGFTHKEMVTALSDQLDTIPKPFDLIGHSLGGKISLQIAHDHPDWIRKLIILDIAPKAYPPHHQHVLAGLSAVPLDTIQSRGEAETYLTPHIDSPMLRQFLLKSLTKTPDGFRWKFNLDAVLNHYDDIAAAPSQEHPIHHPTLFLRGEKSNYILDSDTNLLTTVCPNHTLQTIPNTGHWLHAEDPQTVIQNLLSWIN